MISRKCWLLNDMDQGLVVKGLQVTKLPVFYRDSRFISSIISCASVSVEQILTCQYLANLQSNTTQTLESWDNVHVGQP